MDADFEGGQWIDGEFYYTKRCERRQQTKEDALYGVFADSDGDGDDGGGRRAAKKGRVDFTAPVAFVSKGVVQPEPPPEPTGRRADDAEPAATAGLGSARGGLGLGAQPTSGLGLGFQSAGVQAVRAPPSRGALCLACVAVRVARARLTLSFLACARALQSVVDEDDFELPSAFGQRRARCPTA